ncbi:MAG: DNA phosphorothioation-dependent restriction protein DptH [Cellulosilyticum sp.]|nr:DNA phosphorothioation-dependent restriction protein DptH [Cellulosilyticum sp.]
MLKEYYNYLAKKVVSYFEETGDIEGYKYSVMFENNDQVERLYLELSESEIARPFVYKNNGEIVYKSFYLEFGRQKLIVAATIDQIKTDFLTTLRNSIGTEKEEFQGAGIFIIYDSNLDSISNATASFQKEGMPFHVNQILNDIKSIVNSSNMNKIDKQILLYELNKRASDTYKDNSNLFEYKEILSVINSGQIKKENYKEFRLLYDPLLDEEMKDNEIKKRLEENNRYFERIDQSIRFGDPERDLDNIFTDRMIDRIKKEAEKGDWEEEINFKEVEKSVEEKKSIEEIEIKEIEVYLGGNKLIENMEFFVKGIGSAKSQKRTKDVLIFNPFKHEEIKIGINLTKFPKKETIKNYRSETKVVGKKVEAQIVHTANTCTFEKITVSDELDSKAKVNICIVDVEKVYLDSLVTNYSLGVKKKQQECVIYVNNEDDEIILNERAEQEEVIELKNDETYAVTRSEKIVLRKTSGLIPEDEKYALIKLDIEGLILNLAINDETRKPVVLTGLGAWKAKVGSKQDLLYKGNNRIVHGANEFYARDDFKDHLEIEQSLVEQVGLCWQIKSGNINVVDLEMDEQVKNAYLDYIKYFKARGILPSLSYLNEELRQLAEVYIDTIINCMAQVNDGESLPKSIRNIMKLGTITNDENDEQIKYTPFAPLNVAYQLILNEEIDEEILKDESLLKKMSSVYLLPYIQDDYKNLYKPIEQWHSPEWSYYVGNSTKKYKGSRSFVSKLVREKIEEFVDHFSYLFEQNRNATIKINLINTGDCREVLQGICAYYVGRLKKDISIQSLNPIHISIYNTVEITHIFEEFSQYTNIEEIKDKFGISLDVNDRYTESDVLNGIREKLKFYNKEIDDQEYEYAHITLIEMNQKSDTGIGNMSEISTGVSLKGLISGVPSVHYSDSYRTGYGMKYIDEESRLIKLTRFLNSVSCVSNSSNPYYRDQCLTTELDKHDEENLDKVYNASNWVTFIEPKVDLNFFKTSETSKDLMIIHYSDQYTTSSGYDAITVTRKSKQYQSIIEEHLNQKGVINANEYTGQIINMFNAINGDWLLRLVSSKSYFDKEKISILSAIKLSMAYFNHKDIIWVPISLEEILRVSGGAGLKKSEGIFSAKNLGFENSGATSDDIMLIGLEDRAGELMVHYYPVEVKIGINSSNYIQKAIDQVKTTKSIFMTTLDKAPEVMDLKTKIYRNFMMQLVIVSIEKLKLYQIWEDQNWNAVIDSDLRRKLLNEEYTISTELEEFIGKGAVVSFKKDLQFRTIKKEQDVTILEFTEEDGINYMTRGISSIIDQLMNTSNDIKKDQLLANTYRVEASEPKEPQDHTTENETDDVRQEELITGSGVEEVELPPIIEAEKNKPMEILFGTNQSNSQPVMWYPNDTDKVFHTNTGIIGTMGTGKTQFTKSLITQLHRQSKNNLEGKGIGILIFDYKGDYNKEKIDFIEATNAKVYDLYHLPYNPLALVKTAHPKPMLPLHTGNTLKETLTKGFGLGVVQSNLLKDLIMEAYEGKGIAKNDPSTWDRTPPTLQDVYNRYIDREDLKQDSLYAAFSNLMDFEIFEPDATKTYPLFDLLDGVTVINLAGYDESVQNLVVAITLDLFYSQMQALGHSKIDKNIRQLNKLILVDEADNFLSKDFNALKKILKEGREFGVGTILSTQLLSHFSTADNDYANYILTWVVHNVADLNTKDVKYIFNTHTKQQEDELYNKIKSLEKHYSLVKMGDSDRALHVRDKAFWELDK